MTDFTLEDLVQYIYKETPLRKTVAMRTALQTDGELRQKYEVIVSAQKRLQTLNLSSPRKKVIDKILIYAKKKAKEFTEES